MLSHTNPAASVEKTLTSNSFKIPSFQTVVVFKQQQGGKKPKTTKTKKKKSQTKLLTGALTTTKERMPLKGESHFFLLDSLYFHILAGLSLSSFLPTRRSPPPLPRRENWAGEVSTQEPKLSTSSESPRRRATVREPQQRGARGRRLALHQRKCG